MQVRVPAEQIPRWPCCKVSPSGFPSSDEPSQSSSRPLQFSARSGFTSARASLQSPHWSAPTGAQLREQTAHPSASWSGQADAHWES